MELQILHVVILALLLLREFCFKENRLPLLCANTRFEINRQIDRWGWDDGCSSCDVRLPCHHGITSLLPTMPPPPSPIRAQTEVDERPLSQGETRGDDDSVARLMKHVKVEKQQHVNSNSNNNHIVKRNSLASSLMAAIVALSPTCIAPPAPAVSLAQSITSYITTTTDVEKGATSFRHACIGCHDAGGNIIVPGATLFAKDLVRNGINSEEDIYRIIYSGKGRMPGFGENCTPKGQCTFGPRLQDEEIKLLAEFVKSQADQGWPQHPN